jgi:transcriptional regulator with XRE-family HTH domain
MQLFVPMSNQPSPLTQYRTLTGQSLEALSRPLGVNKTTIMRWENGDTLIPVKRLADLEALTGIPRHKLRPDVFEGAR